MSSSDAKLFASPLNKTGETEEAVCIWRIYFSIEIENEMTKEAELDTPINLGDSLDVLGGPDSRSAQDKAEEFVMNSEKYVIDGSKNFRITGVKKLAEADVL